jgi:tight adherence protein B
MRVSGAVAALAAALAVGCWPTSTARRLRLLDGRAHLRIATRHYVVAGVLAQVGAVVLGVPYVGLGAGCAAIGAGRLLRGRRRRHTRRLCQDACVEVVFALAAELRAGRTPAQALESAAASTDALRKPLGIAARAVRAGAPAADPLRVVAELPGCEALASVAAAWQVTEQAGGAVADVLDRLGQTLDADAADRRSFEAVLAGPRASMALLAGLPALGLAMAQSAGARPLRLLLHRPLGWALLGAAALLEVIGLAWSRRLVRGVMPR